MSSQKKSNKQSLNQKLLVSSALNVILLFALAFVVPQVTRTQPSQPANDSETSVQAKVPDDEEPFREAFIANCVIQAKVNLGKTMANTYCKCVLNRGIEIHGAEGFIELNQRITKTYDMSKLKGIIDECAAKATAERQ